VPLSCDFGVRSIPAQGVSGGSTQGIHGPQLGGPGGTTHVEFRSLGAQGVSGGTAQGINGLQLDNSTRYCQFITCNDSNSSSSSSSSSNNSSIQSSYERERVRLLKHQSHCQDGHLPVRAVMTGYTHITGKTFSKLRAMAKAAALAQRTIRSIKMSTWPFWQWEHVGIGLRGVMHKTGG
jgi:hypothetical protein